MNPGISECYRCNRRRNFPNLITDWGITLSKLQGVSLRIRVLPRRENNENTRTNTCPTAGLGETSGDLYLSGRTSRAICPWFLLAVCPHHTLAENLTVEVIKKIYYTDVFLYQCHADKIHSIAAIWCWLLHQPSPRTDEALPWMHTLLKHTPFLLGAKWPQCVG